MRARFRTLVPLVVAAGCGGGGDKTTEPVIPPATSLRIEQALDTLSELATRRLTVVGTDKNGIVREVGTLTWQSSDTTVATVETTGLVTAVQPGNATITVRSGTLQATTPIRVTAVPVGDITIRLVGGIASDTLLVGTSATVLSEARDVNGRLLRGRTVRLAVADTARGTIDAAGLLTGRAVGFLTLVARADSVERRPQVVVRPPFAAKIALRFADPKKLGDTTWMGLRDSVLVSFADSSGAALAPSPFRPVSYSSDDSKVASVDAFGRVTLVGTGVATIRAKGERLVGARSLVVVRGPITDILAAPDTVRVLPGETTVIRPIFIDGGGVRVTALGTTAVKYVAGAPSVATVDALGTVTGVKPGVGFVTLSAVKGTVRVPVKVLAAVPESDAFRITVRFVGPTPSQEVLDAFAAARAKWEAVIRQTIGTDTLTLAKNSCGSPDSAHVETVRDLLILATIDSIDGPKNVLGSANWCWAKEMPNGHYLPMVGRMRFDSADMQLMAAQGQLGAVIAHEMGHVLGIGTIWSRTYHLGVAMAQQSGFDPRYFGKGGVAASAGMGFTNFTIASATGLPVLDNVPLEDTGGSGTAGSHWRRSVFGNELMNGYAGTGPQPLSLLTISAMADLGYVVSTSAAEAWGTFILGGPSANVLARYLGRQDGGAAVQLREEQPEPEGIVERTGRVRRFRAPTR